MPLLDLVAVTLEKNAPSPKVSHYHPHHSQVSHTKWQILPRTGVVAVRRCTCFQGLVTEARDNLRGLFQVIRLKKQRRYFHVAMARSVQIPLPPHIPPKLTSRHFQHLRQIIKCRRLYQRWLLDLHQVPLQKQNAVGDALVAPGHGPV
jgi:hypothetical protein